MWAYGNVCLNCNNDDEHATEQFHFILHPHAFEIGARHNVRIRAEFAPEAGVHAYGVDAQGNKKFTMTIGEKKKVRQKKQKQKEKR